jgi:hypothetical protein
MLALIERPPDVQSSGDGDDALNRYIVVAENIDLEFVCILLLHAEDEQDCRDLTARWFLQSDHGVPTKCTIVLVSTSIDSFNMTSNDDEVCEHLGIDPPAERK